MTGERSPLVSSNGLPWGKTMNTKNNVPSLTFMEIRSRSLGKALDELRTKRVQLDEDLRKGHVDQGEYASRLLNIIVETNSLNKEKQEVEDKVKNIRTNKLR